MREPRKQSVKPDRRVTRTKQSLQSALVALLSVKAYDEISVIDICNHADVGRSAFYQHFSCKDELFRAGFNRLSDDLVTAINTAGLSTPNEKLIVLAEALFRHGQAHSRIYRTTTAGYAGSLTANVVAGILTPLVERLLRNSSPNGSVTLHLQACVIVSSLLGAMHWWLERGAKVECETIVATVRPMLISTALFSSNAVTSSPT